MADEGDLSAFTPESGTSGPPLPPQAPTPTTTAADIADVAQAPSPSDTLLTANFGDKGAQQYNDLRNAGRTAPIPAAGGGVSPLFGLAGAPSAAGAGNLIGAGLLGLAGHPEAGARAFQQQQQMALAQTREMRENASEFYTALLPAAFKQFPGRPDLAAAFLQNEASSRGIHINPAVAIKLNQDMIDGKLTPAQLDDEISHGDVSTIERLGTHAKFIDDLTKGRAEARAATAGAAIAEAKEPYAGPEAKAQLDEKNLINQKRQLDVDTFTDTLQRQVATEANGLVKAGKLTPPGTPGYTNYMVNRKTQLDEWTKRQNLRNTPLTGQELNDFNQADRAGKFATEALQLLNDPEVAGNRGVVEGRLRNIAWKLGFKQSDKEDAYQSISNIAGLMASKVYAGGIRNMKWINRVLEHPPRPGDELGLVKDKINVLLRAANEQQQGILNTHGRPASQMKPTVEAPTEAGGSGLSTAGQSYFDSLTTSTPPATP